MKHLTNKRSWKLNLWREIHLHLTKKLINVTVILPQLPVKFVCLCGPRVRLCPGSYFFVLWLLLALIKIVLNLFEPETRLQLENKVRLVNLLTGISNVTSHHQKGPSSIVIRWIFNKHIICSWQPKRAQRGGLAVFITGTMSHYRHCFCLTLKVTLLLSLLFSGYWWNNVVIFLTW